MWWRLFWSLMTSYCDNTAKRIIVCYLLFLHAIRSILQTENFVLIWKVIGWLNRHFASLYGCWKIMFWFCWHLSKMTVKVWLRYKMCLNEDIILSSDLFKGIFSTICIHTKFFCWANCHDMRSYFSSKFKSKFDFSVNSKSPLICLLQHFLHIQIP